MIAEVLNREFVLSQLSAVRQDLEAAVCGAGASGRRRGPGGITSGGAGDDSGDQIDGQDVADALAAVTAAADKEGRKSSGQEGFDTPPGDGRRGDGPVPIDNVSFFSRDPVINLLQSALDEHLLEAHAADLTRTAPADTRRGGSSEVAVTDVSIRSLNPTDGDPRRGRRALGQFELADVRWVSATVAMGLRKFKGRHPFNPVPAEPVCLPSRARLVLVGDWGTGLPRARRVGKEMARVLADGAESGIAQHIVHLGDVYYCGWRHEYDRRLLDPWPVGMNDADTIGSWSLNANHDMFSGGHDYYDHLLADPRFARQQRSSLFSLVTPDWQIMGLDTGWTDGELVDPQPRWVEDTVAGSHRKVLLLSHHQLYSAHEWRSSHPIDDVLQPVLETGRVRAWFWGHEHRCTLYGAHRGVAFGRCIGHGGVPVYMWQRADATVKPPPIYEYRAFLQDRLARWALFGFAVLDFDGPTIVVRYIDENGVEHKRETIE